MLRKSINIFALLAILLIASCDNYNKILKSTDVEVKKEAAKKYYNEGNYYKALPLLDELISIYRGQEELEEIYLIYCYAHYGQGNYMTAAYNFKNYYTFYPNSESAEEAMFMMAKSYYQLSPDYELDQTNTLKAIESLQLFVNAYPGSEKVEDCNTMIDELRAKLELKDFVAAKLYMDMESYKAASVSFENVLESYPDTERAEYLHFLIVKSNYLLAKNSILSKQQERYSKTIEAYQELENKFPESDYVRQASNYYESAMNAVNNKKMSN